jgi:hypothetical protein
METPNEKPGGGGALAKVRNESARQRYIRLLSVLSEAKAPHFTDSTDSPEDLMAFEELLMGNFITGVRLADQVNRIKAVGDMRIGVSGRLLLEDLIKKEESTTIVGLLKHNRIEVIKLVGAFVGGVVVTLIAVWLRRP